MINADRALCVHVFKLREELWMPKYGDMLTESLVTWSILNFLTPFPACMGAWERERERRKRKRETGAGESGYFHVIIEIEAKVGLEGRNGAKAACCFFGVSLGK
jgi:hypothetical protein